MPRFVDTDIGFTTFDEGICNQCIHRHKDAEQCDAFPKGIPKKILNGEIDHRQPVEGDNGIQFEAFPVVAETAS